VTATLVIARAGMLTTVQDRGRWGYQGSGVPVAGPMDWYSHALANRLVGNDADAAALEVTLIGPELIVEGRQVVCALAGADFEVMVDGSVVPAHRPFTAPCRSRVRVGTRRAGARATLAVAGGLDVPATFGSRATHLVSGMGPFGGRALRVGDRLPIASGHPRSDGEPGIPLEMPRGNARVRIVPAAHRARFTDEAWRTLTSARFTVTPQSDRMGYRLEGPALSHVRGADILSEAMPIGVLQVPPSGQPILLMADRQTTGGYATIANVITADLPLAGQLAPGDGIEFSACSHEGALAALRARHASLTGART
jgi:biotin-dependent carboxylase-like uncharacterized protein